MNFKLRVSLVLWLSTIISLYAQEVIKPLAIGDSLPDFAISKIINSRRSFAKTSDYKDHLLVIDFWDTYCSNCVEAFPKMEYLQNHFGKKIVILPVSYEKTEKVKSFWKNNKYTRKLSLPTVVEDTMFNRYFPHYGEPHEVWVYKGKVIAITYDNYVDVQNIQKVLNGERINWYVKYDFYKYNESMPIFKSYGSAVPVKYSAIRGYLSDVSIGGRGFVRDSVNKTIRMYALNEQIYSSYLVNFLLTTGGKDLVKPSRGLDSNQVVWEVSDPSIYMHSIKYEPYSQEWFIKNAICYESLVTDTGQTEKDMYNAMNQDMDRLFGLHVRWEKRKEKVWSLRNINSQPLVPSGVRGIGESIHDVVRIFNNNADHVYVFDDVKISPKEYWMNNVKFNSLNDLKTINKAINRYGFEMIEEERLVDKHVFTEINGGLVVNVNKQESANLKIIMSKKMRDALPEENRNFLNYNREKVGVVELESGLQYKVLKNGKGLKPLPNSKVMVNYDATQVNGKLFDTSYEKGHAVVFPVNRLIKGLSEALQMMSVGSKWILYIPAELAYGNRIEGPVPPNSVVVFEVELVDIMNQ